MNLRCLILLVLLWPACASASRKPRKPESLIGKPMPAVRGTTLRGTKVDARFFSGKVTLLNFMFIGCPPCMAEAPMLQALQRSYATDTAFQILTIAPHTAQQLFDFNTNNGSMLSGVRKHFGLETPTYEQLPACANALPHDEARIGPECTTITENFYLDGYPLTLLIDKKGVIRAVKEGFAARADSPTALALAKEWRTTIDQLLRE